MDIMDTREFSDRVSDILKSKKIIKKQFCNDIGISVQNFSLWDKGRVPSAETIIKMSQYLNVSCDYLLLGKEFEEAKKEIEEETKKMEFNREQILASFNTLLDCIENNLKTVENDKK